MANPIKSWLRCYCGCSLCRVRGRDCGEKINLCFKPRVIR